MSAVGERRMKTALDERLEEDRLITDTEPILTISKSRESSLSRPSDRRGRLKVLFVTVGLGTGGTEGQIRDLALKLDRSRFEPIVCALKGHGPAASDLAAGGIRVRLLEGSGFWDIGMVIWRLARLVREVRPDILHAFLPPANVAAGIVGALCRVPVLILSCRDLGISRRRGISALERFVARWAGAITCCSDAVRQSVQRRFGGDPGKYLTLYNGVDVQRFEARLKAPTSISQRGAVIGTVCRLEEPTKGLDVLLNAMALLKRSYPARSCFLLIVGDGPAKRRLEKLSRQLGLQAEVIFAGERHDVERILPRLNLFVLPSLSEGFGIALAEAMAAGLPVVATAVGGIPEVVEDRRTGWLVPPGDPRRLAEAIEQCLAHPEESREAGRRGCERVRQCFSIQLAARQHEALYERLTTAAHR